MVTKRQFLKVFAQQWNDDLEHRRDHIQDAYQGDATWTVYMLGQNRQDFPGSFFDRLAVNLDQQACRERQNLDVVYYTTLAQHAPQEEDMPRPARLNVIVEHENGEDVEKEMWKLLMWRAPLKVLVFYDWPPWRAPAEDWLQDKLNTLFALHQEVNRSWAENAKTAYLFLVGRLQQHGAPPVWEYCASTNRRLRPVPGIPIVR